MLAGSGFYLVDRYSTQMYYEELTQRLNGSIAMYVVGERQLIEDGIVNEDALSLLAQNAVRRLIAGQVEMPFRGTDPRNLDREKVFSAAEVVDDGIVQGDLYAVLGGQKYDESVCRRGG